MGTSELAVHDFLLGEAINLSKRTQTRGIRSKMKRKKKKKEFIDEKGGRKRRDIGLISHR